MTSRANATGDSLQPQLVRQIRRLRRAGNSINELHRLTGLSPTTIKKYLKLDAKVGEGQAEEVRQRNAELSRTPAEVRERILEMWRAGTAQREIVERLSVSKGTVWRYCKEAREAEQNGDREIPEVE